MSKKRYNRRVWLNPANSPSSGSVVCYYGPCAWTKGNTDMFVEVSSCSVSARLHKTDLQSESEYLEKVRKLRDELSKYIEFMDNKAG